MTEQDPVDANRSDSRFIPLPVGDHPTHRPSAGQEGIGIGYARNGCLRESACFAKAWRNKNTKVSVFDYHGFSNIESNIAQVWTAYMCHRVVKRSVDLKRVQQKTNYLRGA